MPGWPYSFVVALESGRSSWTAPLDAVRLTPGADLAAVTATQIRDVLARLIAAGHWRTGDPQVWVVMDAGYDAARLAWLLRDLPVRVLARLRSDRVLRRPVRPRQPGMLGRSRRHSGEFIFGDPASWDDPDVTTVTETRLYGTATARAWHRLHPRLTRWADWPRPADPGRRPDPPGRDPSALRRHRETGLAVVLHQHRQRLDTGRGDGEPVVAGVPAPFRHRAYVPAVPTDPRLDRAETA